MDKTANFTTALPDNYVCVKHVNAKTDKKTMLIYSILSFVPFLIWLPLSCWVTSQIIGHSIFNDYDPGVSLAIFIAALVYLVYIVLHELVHGWTYKFYTGGKLTYGFNLVVAFCGVPQLYVRRHASMMALIMPFIVFSIIFGGLTVGMFFVAPFYGIIAGSLFAFHLGGCVGDLHWFLMYMFKYHGDTLMRDTGPEQWLYKAEN